VKYLSLFSGIEAATQAWHPLGWEPVAFSEIENFPNAVLEHHYPDVPNLGDVTKITENKIKKLGQIDLVVFGSPCQDLSVAGKRKGLDGERSGLFTNAIKIIKWARKHNGCRYALWENVPGAFSSNGGKDFGEVIKLLSGSEFRQEKYQTAGVVIGKEGLVEWRTLDAQHFGVPQRRRRIFALADFGNWESRGPVLFERESVFGDFATSGEARKETPTDARGCFDQQRTGVYGDGNVASTVSARDYKDATDLVVEQPNLSAPLSARDYKGPGTDGINEETTNNMVVYDTVGALCARDYKGVGNQFGDPQNTLSSSHHHAVAFSSNMSMPDARTDGKTPTLKVGSGGTGNPPAVAYSVMPMNSGKDYKARETDVAQPIMAGGPVGGNQGGDYIVDQPQTAVAYALDSDASNSMKSSNPDSGCREVDVSRCLDTTTPDPSKNQGGNAIVSTMQVRRLTPKECERLQGFPDDYTKIPYRKKDADDCPDGPRYKALGNSMAVPVMRWIGERINQAD
jgi:DNA (cytosine-5)-methyltransferase 1